MGDCIGDLLKIGVHRVVRNLFYDLVIPLLLVEYISNYYFGALHVEGKGLCRGTPLWVHVYVTFVLCVIVTASSSGTSFFVVRRTRNASDGWQNSRDYGKEKEERRGASSPFSPSRPLLNLNFHQRDVWVQGRPLWRVVKTVCLILLLLLLLLLLGGRGTWTEDEVKCLKEAVYQVTKTAEDQPVPFHGIYWPDVAKIVKTRNIEQCRRKWRVTLDFICFLANRMSWKMGEEKYSGHHFSHDSFLTSFCSLFDITPHLWLLYKRQEYA